MREAKNMAYSHPNSHLCDSVIENGLWAASGAFRRCLMEPTILPTGRFGCNSLLYGELGEKRFLVFVRMTLNDEVEGGTGPLPGIAFDAAAELGAEPHVMRVHMMDIGPGVGFAYYGREEFIRHVLSHTTEWNARLIAPKSVADYVRMLRGQISKLDLDLHWEWRDEEEKEENLSLKLFIDGDQPYLGAIDPGELLRSSVQSDGYEIFTCSCGEAGCVGIFRGVVVVNEGSLTLWKAYHARRRRIFLFDRNQYREEILRKCGEAIQFARSRENRHVVPYIHHLKPLEKAFYAATENVPMPASFPVEK